MSFDSERWAGEKPIAYGTNARTIGSIALIEPGVRIYSRARGSEGVDDEGEQIAPTGGIVIDHYDRLDPETQEILRVYQCLAENDQAWPRVRWCAIAESEIDRERVEAAEPFELVRLWRLIGEQLAFRQPYKRRTTAALPDEIRLAHALHVLVYLVAGPAGPLHAMTRPSVPQQPALPRPRATVNPSVFVD